MTAEFRELVEKLLKDVSEMLSRGLLSPAEKKIARDLSFKLFISMHEDGDDERWTGDWGIKDSLKVLDSIFAAQNRRAVKTRGFYGASRLGVIRAMPRRNTIFLRKQTAFKGSKLTRNFFARLQWFEKRVEAQSGLIPRLEVSEKREKIPRDELALITKKI